jgi:rhamnosyltransferase
MRYKNYSIVTVIVTFNPNINRFIKVLDAASKQTQKIIIVDNASKNIKEIKKVLLNNAKIIELSENLGLSAALNIGIKNAIEAFDPDWILTLDDDTILYKNAIKKVLNEYNLLSITYKEKIGVLALSPNKVNKLHINQVINNSRFVYKEFVQTSGNLIKTTILKSIKFRTDFFIDQIDFEFDINIRKAGFYILEYCHKLLKHKYGRYVKIRLLYKTKLINYYNETRLFYITRNSTFLLLYYNHKFPIKLYILQLLTVYYRFLEVNGIHKLFSLIILFIKAVIDAANHNLGKIKNLQISR